MVLLTFSITISKTNLVHISLTVSVFSIWKSMWVLQTACIKIVAHAIYTYLFFSYTYTLVFCWKIWCCCLPQQIRPQTTVQLYILWDYSGVRIGFNMIKNHHTVYSISCLWYTPCQFKLVSFSYTCFSLS